jgi:hypothetical protein
MKVVFWDVIDVTLFAAREECNVLFTSNLVYLISECGTIGTQIVIYITRLRSFKM